MKNQNHIKWLSRHELIIIITILLLLGNETESVRRQVKRLCESRTLVMIMR